MAGFDVENGYKGKTVMDLILIIFGVAAIILSAVTVFLVVKGSDKLKSSYECEGIIIGFHKDDTSIRFNSDNNVSIAPIISYSVNDQTYEFIANYYSTTMKQGDIVKVLYDKQDFTKASIKGGTYFGPLITGILALCFFVFVGIILIIKSKGLIVF